MTADRSGGGATMVGVNTGNTAKTMRRAAAVLVALLVAGSCGGGGEKGPPKESAVGGEVTMPTTQPSDGAAPPSSGPAATTANTTSGGRGSPSTTRATGSSNTTVAPSGDGTTVPSGPDGRRGAPGQYARALLRPSPVTSITIEVTIQNGASLRDGTVALVEDTLEDVTGKEVTVTGRTVNDATPSGGWTPQSINAFADRHGRDEATSSKAVLRFLALKSGMSGQDATIGVAVRGDVLAIFVDKIDGASTPLVDATTIEQAVAVHEAGHILGLVDITLDRNREDPEHPGHSRNRGSVMFWAIETNLVGQVLNGPPPRTFDRDDLDDLAAMRGGA